MLNQNRKVRVARIAGRQFGRVSFAQLLERGVDRRTVHDWCEQGYLYRLHPRVYAVGHRAKTVEADLAAALLYAGPGAMLSHATAAWWVGLATSQPHIIHVSTPRHCRSIRGIRVHKRRSLDRTWHRNLPVTQLPQTLVDYATMASLSMVRVALARADYEGELNLRAIEGALKRGCRGSAKLRRALKRHQPMLARARSGIEIQLFELCEAARFPLPELNARVAGWDVDALWREQRIAVELDGPDNHRSRGQTRRDRRKEFELRATGLTVVRYSDDQMDHHPQEVIEELGQLLADARGP
jgi:very-short-patch-repair endonuclease/predicted transcriptional regulator of viral defense system